MSPESAGAGGRGRNPTRNPDFTGEREPARGRGSHPHREPSRALFPAAFQVVERRTETPATFTLTLRGSGPVPFEPGQFTMAWVFGAGEVPISVSGDPSRPQELVHTIRAVGSVTSRLAELGPGDTLGIRGPFGTAWPFDRARERDLVLVAGGIGMAPLRPVLYAVAARRADFGRVSLLLGSRSPDLLLFREEMEDLCKDSDMELWMTVDTTPVGWKGDVGLVSDLIPRLGLEPEKTVAMACGPEIMMRVAADRLLEEGLNPDDVFVSLERNMKCAVGFCGHCQLGPEFVCKDGPVFSYGRIRRYLSVRRM